MGPSAGTSASTFARTSAGLALARARGRIMRAGVRAGAQAGRPSDPVRTPPNETITNLRNPVSLMTLSETARERLRDVRDLEPTTNGELRDRWGMDSGKDVAAYLRGELSEHTYRDENGKIRAVADVDDGGGAVGDATTEDDVSPSSDAGSGESSSSSPGADAQSDGVALEPSDDTDTMTFTPDEFDEAARGAFETGYQQGQEEAEPIEVESETVDGDSGSASPTGPDGGCPECGGALRYDNEGDLFFATEERTLVLEVGDRVCESCDLVVGNDGVTYYGTESSKAGPSVTCSCGETTVGPGHAQQVIGMYYEGTSSLRVVARRRMKKVSKRIAEQDPRHVCVNCWTVYA